MMTVWIWVSTSNVVSFALFTNAGNLLASAIANSDWCKVMASSYLKFVFLKLLLVLSIFHDFLDILKFSFEKFAIQKFLV